MKKLLKSAAVAALFALFFGLSGFVRDVPLLVNKSNPLPKDYVPADLCELKSTRCDGRPLQMMCKKAAESLDAMLSDLNASFPDSTPVSVTSGYRSYEYQKSLYSIAVEDHRELFTAPPGASEHQSGLAADLHDMKCASGEFEKSEKFRWLCENAYKYGFVLRYPRGKENVTGYAFEPWHWRYVGRFHAEKMYFSGLCLEEYAEIIKK